MKKRLLLAILVLSCVPAVVQGALTFLPESTYISDVAAFDTGTTTGYIEFAVYDTSIQDIEGYTRDEQFIYAYQVFSTSGIDIDAISILGIGAGSVVDDGLDVTDELGGSTTLGKDATGILQSENTEAYFQFNKNGVLAASDNSWFLLIFSDNDVAVGTYEINPSDSDIIVPGDDDGGTNVPEPATMVLLLAGGLLTVSLRRV